MATTRQEPGSVPGRGTYPLAELATVVIRGADVPEAQTPLQELVLAAWNVHLAIVTAALREQGGQDELKGGIPGYTWTGELPALFRSLWKANASPLPASGQPHDAARIQITRWLADKKVLLPVERGHEERRDRDGKVIATAKPTQWWVSRDFRGAPPGFRVPLAGTETEPAPDEPDETDGQVTRSGAGAGHRNTEWPCREPGCQEAPLTTSVQRGAHENREHPHSRYRIWVCPRCGREGTFYSEQGLGNHMSKLHEIVAGTDSYATIMDQIKARQAKHPVVPARTTAQPQPAVVVPPPPPPPPLPPPPAPPAPALIPAPVSRRPVLVKDQSPAPQPVTAARSLSSQLADLAGAVRQLEERGAEIAELRRENAELREKVSKAQAVDRAADDLMKRLEELRKNA